MAAKPSGGSANLPTKPVKNVGGKAFPGGKKGKPSC